MTKRVPTAKKSAAKKTVPKKAASKKATIAKGSKKTHFFVRLKDRVGAFVARRPHRSFRRTRRRDYTRSLKLPGYWSFTFFVVRTMRENWRPYLLIGVLYTALTLLLIGLGSQESFSALRETLNETGKDLFQGNWGEVGKASLLAVSTIAGNISPALTEAQQIYAVLLGLIVWLTIVWFLRQRMAGRRVLVRDALYNAGAPIVPMFLVFLVVLIQLIPVALVMIAYSAAQATGLLSGGVEAMLFWAAAVGLVVLSLYWITGSLMSLIVVTLPGMYPMKALRIAGDMVVGRRLRILYRFLWMALMLAIVWIIVLVVTILLDAGIKQLWPAVDWLPVVPVILMILGTVSLLGAATYIYLLYRRIVDDDAKSA